MIALRVVKYHLYRKIFLRKSKKYFSVFVMDFWGYKKNSVVFYGGREESG